MLACRTSYPLHLVLLAVCFASSEDRGSCTRTISSPTDAVKRQADVLKRKQAPEVVCRQLGPVLHSPTAESHGLGTSLLEALVRYHDSQSLQYAKQGLASCLGNGQHMYYDSSV